MRSILPTVLALVLACAALAAPSAAAFFPEAEEEGWVKMSCAVVPVPEASVAGGKVSACVTSTVKACGVNDAGRWICRVQYSLNMTVEAPLTCGEAHSTATPGVPPSLLACASVIPILAARIVDHDVDATEQTHFRYPSWVCSRLNDVCKSWNHVHTVPANPNAAPDVMTLAGTASQHVPRTGVTIRDGGLFVDDP